MQPKNFPTRNIFTQLYFGAEKSTIFRKNPQLKNHPNEISTEIRLIDSEKFITVDFQNAFLFHKMASRLPDDKRNYSYPRTQSENDSRKHLSSRMGSKIRSTIDSYGSNPNIVSNAQVKEGKHPSVQSEIDSRKYSSGRKRFDSYSSALHTITSIQEKEGDSYPSTHSENDSRKYPSGRKRYEGSPAIDLFGSTSNTVLNAQITEERSYPSIHTANDFKMYPSQRKEYIEKSDASRKAPNVEPNAQEGKIERGIHKVTSENEDEKESSGRKRSKFDSAGASFSSSDTQNTAIYHIVKEENIAHPHSKQRSLVRSLDRVQQSFQKMSNEMQDEMQKLLKEVKDLEMALLNKKTSVKLAETRFRPGSELVQAEELFGFADKVLQLSQTREDLIKKTEEAKTTYNALEAHLICLYQDVENKEHALMTDLRCLDMREDLKKGEFAVPTNQTQRNIELTRM